MKKIFLSFLCVAMAAMAVDAKTIYVKDGANGNGTSWTDAFGTLNAAVDASVEGDQIWVGPGLFTITKTSGANGLLMKATVSIYGGFAGTETAISERTKGASGKPWDFVNVTEIKGVDDNTRLFQMPNLGVADGTPVADRPRFEPGIFDGLKITHVNASQRIMWSRESSVIWRNCQFIGMQGGGLYFEDAKGGVEDSYFEGCQNAITLQTVAMTRGYGATTFIKNCEFTKAKGQSINIFNVKGDAGLTTPSAEITNCKFYNNKSTVMSTNPAACAITMNQGDITRPVVVTDCLFTDNALIGYGAATIVKWGSGSVAIYNNVFKNNSNTYVPGAGEGGYGAIFSMHTNASGTEGTGVAVFNNLFVNNSAERLIYGSGYFFNNTVADNTGKILIQDKAFVWNNIFANNLVDGADGAVILERTKVDNVYTETTATVYVYNAQMSIPKDVQGDFIEDGNVLITNPGFADASAGNYSLASGSACLGIGSNLVFENDLAPTGLARLMDGMADMSGTAYDIKASTLHAGAYQGTVTGLNPAEKAIDFEAFGVANGIVVKVQDAAQLNIYSFNGQLVAARQINGGETFVPVTKGLYLVKVADKAASATVKVAVK